MPLGQRGNDCIDSRYAGLRVGFSEDIRKDLTDALHGGFDFILTPLARPDVVRTKDECEMPSAETVGRIRSDVGLYSSQWHGQIVGEVSGWLYPSSDDDELAASSTAALKQELHMATHLGIQAVLVRPPIGCLRYVQIMNHWLQSSCALHIWMHISLHGEDDADATGETENNNMTVDGEKSNRRDPWEWWDTVRRLCEESPRLGITLELGPRFPSESLLSRWMGEPLRSCLLSTSVFVSNKQGFPVLPKSHQDFVTKLLNRNVQIILHGTVLHQPAEAIAHLDENRHADAIMAIQNQHPLRLYWEYMSYIFRRINVLNDLEALEVAYRDCLQAPLQPLMDNLESATYEIFERDNAKYELYEEAVYRALLDRVSEDMAKEGHDTVLMVVGAGRGPIVRASLRAADRSSRKLRVYAVEKNPNAVATLFNFQKTDPLFEGRVTILPGDMRLANPPEKADILVSELLGSFGDNELSPECLDGAQRFLKDDGISIPQSYTSFLAPITASKLWNDVKAYKDLEHFETPYVVKLHAISSLAPVQGLFTFEHPNRSASIDNTRYDTLKFRLGDDSVSCACHGFAGYFDCVLYGDVHMSTHPEQHSVNMYSWFPIFFPLRFPIKWERGAEMEVHFWRCVGNTKVWYEWAVASPLASPVHNPCGRSYWVGL